MSIQNKKNELVSIGIPVYNGSKFLEKVLLYLINQTYNKIEIIISDNCSSDTTQAICEKFQSLDNRIIYIRQNITSKGMVNFTYVLNKAKGKYFFWNAHDDIRDLNYIEMCLKVFKSDHNVGLVHSDSLTYFTANNLKIYTSGGYINYKKNKAIKFLFRLFNENPGLIYGMHKLEFLKDFHEATDYDYKDNYISIYYEINSVIKTIPLPLFNVGVNGHSLIGRPTNGKFMSSKYFCDYIYRLLIQNFSLPIALLLFIITKIVYKRIDYSINKTLKH
jgi:glycosyltransferase involved in cell wall biosynthesis